MNEISRCCRVLGVQRGATHDEVKAAYRDLVQVWHPDRFVGKERLQASAQDKLREINLAWRYLDENGFVNAVLVEPEEGTESLGNSANSAGEVAKRSNWFWILGVTLLLVMLISVIVLRGGRAPVVKAMPVNATNVEASATPTNPVEPVTVPSIFPFVTDVLAGNARTNKGTGWLEFPPLLEPPFAVRVDATLTDLDEFRLHYAMGQIVFNWANQLKSLFMVSPESAMNTIVPNEGILLPGTRHSILWIVQTNSMTVQVDGKTRFQTNDNFSGLNGRVSVQSFAGSYNFAAFEVQTPQDPRKQDGSPSERTIFANDILPTMIPETNLTEHFGPDGVTMQSAKDWGYGLMSSELFRPPFTIRTRAKTDAYNLRLFCENGMVIFNWELNSRELRVHDPLNGASTPIANEGFILPNEWHDIVWSIQPMGMTLMVDGKIRFRNHKDYRAVNGKIGLGAFMSELTVDYFVVEKK